MKPAKVFLSLALLSLLVVPCFVFAQDYVKPTVGTITTIPEVYELVEEIMFWVFTFAIVIAVIFIILGGLGYVTAGGDETKVAAAKAKLMGGIIGFFIVVGVYTIIVFIANLIGITNLPVPGIGP